MVASAPAIPIHLKMNRNVRKRTLGYVRPAKIQISLRIRAVWSESLLGAFRIAKDAKFLCVDKHWSDCANAQADLSLRWPHISDGMFSRAATQMTRNCSQGTIHVECEA